MKALAAYVDFGELAPTVASAPTTALVGVPVAAALAPASAPPAAAPAPAAGGIAALKKGSTLREVEALLGPAATASEAREGAMTVTKRTYRHDGLKVTASFVSDVLVDFTITPGEE